MFYGNVEIYNYLIKNYGANIGLVEKKEYDIGTQVAEYLLQSKIRIDDEILSFALKEKNYSEATEKIWNMDESLHVTEQSQQTINEMIPDEPRLLILGDSYFGDEIKFVANHFSSVCMIHSREILNYRKYIELFKPDYVIIETAERVIGPSEYVYFNYNDYILSVGLN